MDNEQLFNEAYDFLHWLREMGVRVWADWQTKQLVFTPRARMTEQMAVEACRLRNYLPGLIGPGWSATMNPYQRSWN